MKLTLFKIERENKSENDKDGFVDIRITKNLDWITDRISKKLEIKKNKEVLLFKRNKIGRNSAAVEIFKNK